VSSLIRRTLLALAIPFIFLNVVAAQSQASGKPLRRAEVLALVGGRSLPENIVHTVAARGLAFRVDEAYRAQLQTAGADDAVLAAVNKAKLGSDPGPADKWELELLGHLTSASASLNQKKYTDAGAELTAALKSSVRSPEAGFVMGAILREQEEFEAAAEVYTEVLREDPSFPDAHTKLSFILYKLKDSDSCLREAKLALSENPQNPEAHKNMGLGYLLAGKFDASLNEDKEALRLKPDYAVVHGNMGIVYDNQHDYDNAIVEYKKATVAFPDNVNYHYNLGTMLGNRGEYEPAVRELREAKRLDPTRVDVRINLASFLERLDMRGAVVEFRELEKVAPDFQVCQKCLADALYASGEQKEALEHYRKAAQLDPTDFEVSLALGRILEDQKRNDEALSEYQRSEFMAPNAGATHLAVGRVLLAQKDTAKALPELKRAAVLSPADAEVHEMLGCGLTASGDDETALAEFKEAVALDPKRSQAMLGWAELLEKRGDWANAMERYHQAAALETARDREDHHGQPFLSSTIAQTAYRSAQARLEEHIKELKVAGKTQEVAALEQQMQAAESSAGSTVKLQELMHSGDEARANRRLDEAENFYKQAVNFADKTSGSDETLATALLDLGGVYGMRQNYSEGDAVLHRALKVIEKNYGAGSPRSVQTLEMLAGNSLAAKDFTAADNYVQRAIELSQKDITENNPTAYEALRMAGVVYSVEKAYPKARPVLEKAVDLGEKLWGAKDYRTISVLYALCDAESHLDQPKDTEACYQRLVPGMESVYGESNPALVPALAGYAKSLKLVGRQAEAAKIEERAASIGHTP